MADAYSERSATRLLDILLAFFVALAVALRPMLPGHGGGANLWVEMCVFIAAMCWLVRMAMARRLRIVFTGVGIPLAVLLAIAGFSTLRSPHQAASVSTLLEWVSYAALFLVLVNATAGRLDRRFVLRLLWASAFVVCLYGLFQQFVNLPLLREQILADRERVIRELQLRPEDYDNLAARASGRIFSTFLLANSFAGFLALVTPGFVGYVLDRLRAGDRRAPFLVASALWVGGTLACLLLTFSKGGWVAFAVGSGLFCLMLGRALLRRHWPWVAGIAASAALGIGTLFTTGVIPARIFSDAVRSMDVRVGYWRTGWAMATDNLLGGVGLGAFGSHYPRYRWVLARVTQQAHNDYLQVLAELGVFGLAAFVAVWAGVLWRSLATRSEPGGRGFPPRLGYVAGILAFAATSALMATFTLAGWGTEPWFARVPKALWDTLLPLALVACWVVWFALLGRGERAEPGELCRKGLVCGLVAFLLHCAVDFDYYEPGVAFTAWVVAALAVAPRGKAFERRLSVMQAVVVGGAAMVAMVGFQCVMTRSMLGQADADSAHGLAVQAIEAQEDGRFVEAQDLVRQSRTRYEQALLQRPLDAELRLQYAAVLARLVHSDGYTNPPLFERTVGLYREAAELDRASPAPHVRLAQFFERAAYARAGALLAPYVEQYTSARRGPSREPRYLPAVAEYEAALERDPNRPKLHLMLGQALWKLGEPNAARRHADRALELHKMLVEHFAGHILRLRPQELREAEELLEKTGGGRTAP